MRPRRPPRLDRAIYTGGARIFFTMCNFERHRYFASGPLVHFMHSELLRTAGECDCELLAYCYMPDHLHILIAGAGAAADALSMCERFRRRSGLAWRREHGGRLWQDGFFDRVLRSADATYDVVRYIVADPVRAGLCAEPVRYPYSGASRCSLADLPEAASWRPTSLA